MVMCEAGMEGKTGAEVAAIWEDGKKKRSKKKIADAYAEIFIRVEDSQLAHMHSCDLETVLDTSARVHCAHGWVMWLELQRKLLRAWRKLCQPGLAM